MKFYSLILCLGFALSTSGIELPAETGTIEIGVADQANAIQSVIRLDVDGISYQFTTFSTTTDFGLYPTTVLTVGQNGELGGEAGYEAAFLIARSDTVSAPLTYVDLLKSIKVVGDRIEFEGRKIAEEDLDVRFSVKYVPCEGDCLGTLDLMTLSSKPAAGEDLPPMTLISCTGGSGDNRYDLQIIYSMSEDETGSMVAEHRAVLTARYSYIEGASLNVDLPVNPEFKTNTTSGPGTHEVRYIDSKNPNNPQIKVIAHTDRTYGWADGAKTEVYFYNSLLEKDDSVEFSDCTGSVIYN